MFFIPVMFTYGGRCQGNKMEKYNINVCLRIITLLFVTFSFIDTPVIKKHKMWMEAENQALSPPHS